MAYLERRHTKRAVWIATCALFSAGAFAWVSIVLGDPLIGVPAIPLGAVFFVATRRLTRCPRCRGSALWWSATHTERGPFPLAVFRLEACPYCGYDASPR